MGSGRKGTPTVLKVLQGNPGRRPLNKNEPKPPNVMPKCPKQLVGEARKEWKRMAPLLHKIGLLTEIDTAVFSGYCAAWGRWIDAEEKLREHGLLVKYQSKTDKNKFVLQQSPMLSIANRAMDQMKQFLSEMGMSPSARSRIMIPGSGKAKDAFAEFIDG